MVQWPSGPKLTLKSVDQDESLSAAVEIGRNQLGWVFVVENLGGLPVGSGEQMERSLDNVRGLGQFGEQSTKWGFVVETAILRVANLTWKDEKKKE